MVDRKGRIILSGDPSNTPEWEGIIDEVSVESLPIRFITELRLNLNNGSKTFIDVPKILSQSLNYDQAAQRVNNIIREHQEVVSSIDFKVNLEGLRKDVTDATAAFSKKVNKTIKRKSAEEKQQKWNKKRGGDQS